MRSLRNCCLAPPLIAAAFDLGCISFDWFGSNARAPIFVSLHHARPRLARHCLDDRALADSAPACSRARRKRTVIDHSFKRPAGGEQFYFTPRRQQRPPLQYGSKAVAVGQYPWSLSGWSGQRQLSVAIHTGTDEYTAGSPTAMARSLAADGRCQGLGIELVSNHPAQLQQDLNDGIISCGTKDRDRSFGSTSLVQVGNNFYFYPVGSSGPAVAVRRQRSRSAVSVELYRGGANGERLSSRNSYRHDRYTARSPTAMARSLAAGRAVLGSRVRARAQIAGSVSSRT
jgi:hypothetical protein